MILNQPVRFVVYRYKHHSPHSGYSRLAEYGLNQFQGESLAVKKPLPRSIIRERFLWRLAKGTPGYDRAAMAAELTVVWKMLRESGFIYHFLYGETTYHYAGLINNLRQNCIVASFHLPPDGIRQAIHIDWHLKQLSAAVCVGRNQQEYLSKILNPDRVFYVPLGVDTEYFTPPDAFESRNPDLCIFVGENYRDYPTLRGVIELVTYKRPNTQFIGITSPRAANLLGYHPNLTLCSGISEPELRDLYRSATLLVMPLLDTTANNAILESMACGLPMVVTEIGAIRDYASPECAIFAPSFAARAMADRVLDLLDAEDERRNMSKYARKRALEFAWPKVVEQLRAVYQTIA